MADFAALAFSSSDEEEDTYIIRRKKIFRERINFFTFEAHEFKERFRLRPTEAEFVLTQIGRDLKHRTTKNMALQPQQQLLAALHFLSNGSQYHGIADMHGVSKATICRLIGRVVNTVIRKMFPKVVRWPTDCSTLSQRFFQLGGFPMVCGAVDGTIVNIKAPSKFEENFVDRHGRHSLNCMMICGPEYNFYAVNSRFPGSVHDARVLRSSAVADRFDQQWRPFPGAVILGDSGYGLSNWIIPPLRRNPDSPQENRFNVAHKRTRRIIENSFGMLKNRFPCLRYLRVKPEYAGKIVMVCAVFHNIANKTDFPDFDRHDDDGDNNLEIAEGGEAKLQELLQYFR